MKQAASENASGLSYLGGQGVVRAKLPSFAMLLCGKKNLRSIATSGVASRMTRIWRAFALAVCDPGQ